MQTQVAPETRHIAIGRQSTVYAWIFNYCILSRVHNLYYVLLILCMVQKLRPHQQSVILAYNVNCYYLLPLLQLQQKLVLVHLSQFFLISVMLMMISMTMRVILLQILHNQLFMKRPPVHLNLSQVYQLKSNKHI